MNTALMIYNLVTLLHRIEEGRIKVPAFQREFVWNKKDIVELIKSVYKGYPIGVLIFLHSNERIFETANSSLTGFPDTPEEYPITYVIDGTQRLSALYNCFYWKSLDEPSDFNIIFDFDKGDFIHFRKSNLPKNYIHLSSIFSSERFIDMIRSLRTENSDNLLESATNLHYKFQDYKISVMEIIESNINDVIKMFVSLNTSGKTLTRAELSKARSQLKE